MKQFDVKEFLSETHDKKYDLSSDLMFSRIKDFMIDTNTKKTVLAIDDFRLKNSLIERLEHLTDFVDGHAHTSGLDMGLKDDCDLVITTLRINPDSIPKNEIKKFSGTSKNVAALWFKLVKPKVPVIFIDRENMAFYIPKK